jgi:2,4-dienoyl-CoA reductase-like NADH-dependent reductase (Old Yellow Enzyme family)
LGTFSYLATELGKRKLAFLCARESLEEPRLGPALKRAFGGVYIANQGHTVETAQQVLAAGEADAVAWGRLFIANPDLPHRLQIGAALNTPNVATFYGGQAEGYTDYPALYA